MAYTILASVLLDGGVDPADAVQIVSPLAGIWYTLDVAWGPAVDDGNSVVPTALTCAGATVDPTYSRSYRGHQANASRRPVDMGWNPNALPVYLSPMECALGFWRIKFPTAGDYSAAFDGLGSLAFTAIGSAPVPTYPTVTVIEPRPFGRLPSKLLRIAFTGDYPAGGLDFTGDLIGLRGLLFADVQDTAAYRFTWINNKLRLYTDSAEASGAIAFSTTGLFLGTVG